MERRFRMAAFPSRLPGDAHHLLQCGKAQDELRDDTGRGRLRGLPLRRHPRGLAGGFRKHQARPAQERPHRARHPRGDHGEGPRLLPGRSCPRDSPQLHRGPHGQYERSYVEHLFRQLRPLHQDRPRDPLSPLFRLRNRDREPHRRGSQRLRSGTHIEIQDDARRGVGQADRLPQGHSRHQEDGRKERYRLLCLQRHRPGHIQDGRLPCRLLSAVVQREHQRARARSRHRRRPRHLHPEASHRKERELHRAVPHRGRLRHLRRRPRRSERPQRPRLAAECGDFPRRPLREDLLEVCRSTVCLVPHQPGYEDRLRPLRRRRQVQARHLHGREPLRERHPAERQEAPAGHLLPHHLQAGGARQGTLRKSPQGRSHTALRYRGRRLASSARGPRRDNGI